MRSLYSRSSRCTMNQGLEVLDREALVLEASVREVLVLEVLVPGVLVLEVLVLVVLVLEVLVLAVLVLDLVEERRHSLQLQMRDSHTRLGKVSVILYLFYSHPLYICLCIRGTMIVCLLVCCIYPNLPCSRNMFWGNTRPSLFRYRCRCRSN